MTDATGAIIANRYIGEAAKRSTELSGKIAAGTSITKASQDAAGSAIASKIKADQAGLRQAAKNAKQGASLIQTADKAYEKVLQELTRMRELATQVNNGALQADERAQANAEYQQRLQQIDSIADTTRFGVMSLLNGGGGDVTLHSNGAAVAAAVSGAVASGTAMTAGTIASQTGFNSGAITEINVEDTSSASIFKVSMKIGDQLYEGLVDPVDDGTMTVTSVSNSANSITWTLGASATADMATSGATKLHLTNSLSNASLVAASADAAAANTFDVASFSASSSTAEGKYSVTFNNVTDTFTLQNEAGQTWTKAITATAGVDAVEFDNGLSFNMVAGFDGSADITQVTVGVGAGDNVSLDFQTNIKGTDISTVNFVSSTTSDLNLAGGDINTVTGAVTALDEINDAINSINIARANIGALQSRFESIIENNAIQEENLGEIQETFTGLDYARTQTDLTRANVQMQAAIAIASQKNQEMNLVLKLLQ